MVAPPEEYAGPRLRHTAGVTRLTLSRQLLALQMIVVVLVVLAVAGVSAVQTDQAFRRHESRRLLATAEATASEVVVRSGMTDLDAQTALGTRLERVRAAAGASYVLAISADGRVVPDSVPFRDDDLQLQPAVVDGASWVGEEKRHGVRAIEAQVAVLGDETYGEPGEVLGTVVLGRVYPSRLEVLRAGAPDVFLYLALAGVIGVVGSLLLARRVKRQTLGLEPSEIVRLVEQREAMLHGVREGVVGVDRNGVVTFANDEAGGLLGVEGPLLGRPVDELGCSPELTAILRGTASGEDLVVAEGGRLLVLNSQPVRVRGVQTGWVTSMRDRTELLGLREELARAEAGTDTLRAQVHEFRNRLHVIAGMAELGRVEQVRDFVQAVTAGLDDRVAEVTGKIADPALASLLVAKSSRAHELGVGFDLSEDSVLSAQEATLSADLVTVVGNLVDNAFEAVEPGGRVEVDVRESDGRIVVRVSDTGRGIAAEDLARVFELGWTTKTGADARSHGFGLALTRMACRRHGGSVTVEEGNGAVLRAELLTGAPR